MITFLKYCFFTFLTTLFSFTFGQNFPQKEVDFYKNKRVGKHKRIKYRYAYDKDKKLVYKMKKNIAGKTSKIIDYDTLGNKKITQYRHGIKKEKLNSTPKKVIYYSGKYCDDSNRHNIMAKYGCTEVTVLRCIQVIKRDLFISLHNKGNDIIQFFRFGPYWKIQMKKEIEEVQ